MLITVQMKNTRGASIGGDNLSSLVGIGLTDLSNIGPPGSGITAV